MTHMAGELPHWPIRSHHELRDAGRVTHVLRQCFSYVYDAPIRELNHRLVVIPPRRHGGQRRRRHSVTVSVADACVPR